MTKAAKGYLGKLGDHTAQKVICHLAAIYVTLICDSELLLLDLQHKDHIW